MRTYDETLQEIEQMLGVVPDFMQALPPEVLQQEWVLMKKYALGEAMIPPQYRALIALSVAAVIKCPYCSLLHRGLARLQGATEDELAEVAFLASYTARWSVMMHAQHIDDSTFREDARLMSRHLEAHFSAQKQ
jgi:AhpD family alkylhydroperoxidase